MVVVIQYVCIPNQLIDAYSSIKVKKERKKKKTETVESNIKTSLLFQDSNIIERKFCTSRLMKEHGFTKSKIAKMGKRCVQLKLNWI